MNEEKRLLTVAEAAAILRIGRTKVYELVRTRSLPVVRLGKAIRIPRAELERYILEKTELPKPEYTDRGALPRENTKNGAA